MQDIADPREFGQEVRPNPKCPGPTPRRAYGSEAIDANSGTGSSAAVRASIVALKPGNSGGAKGCRKVDA